MPKVVDREERRRHIAAALWRVAYRDGWPAVSLRSVAAEAGLSLGSVQHYFDGINDLIHYAVSWVRDVLQDRLDEQLDALRSGGDPPANIATLLRGMIPGTRPAHDPEAVALTEDQWRVQVLAWLALAGRAAQDAELSANLIDGSTRLAQAIAATIRNAIPSRTANEARRDAAGLLAMVEGLLVQLGYGLLDRSVAAQVIDQQVARVFTSSPERRRSRSSAD